MVLVYRLCFPLLRFFFRILVLFSFSFSSFLSFFVFVLALFSFHCFPYVLSHPAVLFSLFFVSSQLLVLSYLPSMFLLVL